MGRSEGEHIVQLPHKNTEVFLCESGFGFVFERHISNQKRNRIPPVGKTDYWEKVVDSQDNTPKPAVISEVIEEIQSGNVPIPQLLKDILEAAKKRAEHCT